MSVHHDITGGCRLTDQLWLVSAEHELPLWARPQCQCSIIYADQKKKHKLKLWFFGSVHGDLLRPEQLCPRETCLHNSNFLFDVCKCRVRKVHSSSVRNIKSWVYSSLNTFVTDHIHCNRHWKGLKISRRSSTVLKLSYFIFKSLISYFKCQQRKILGESIQVDFDFNLLRDALVSWIILCFIHQVTHTSPDELDFWSCGTVTQPKARRYHETEYIWGPLVNKLKWQPLDAAVLLKWNDTVGWWSLRSFWLVCFPPRSFHIYNL